MKIEFEGSTNSILEQMKEFIGYMVTTTSGVVTTVVQNTTEEKRKPGRPPNPNSKKAKEHIIDPPTSPTTDDLFDEAPKHVTKDDLTEALKKLSETHSINKVREVFAKFGVARLGELDEKRYHEMASYVQGLP